MDAYKRGNIPPKCQKDQSVPCLVSGCRISYVHPFSKLGERVVALCQNDENLHHFTYTDRRNGKQKQKRKMTFVIEQSPEKNAIGAA
jgi:hypothetical protein